MRMPLSFRFHFRGYAMLVRQWLIRCVSLVVRKMSPEKIRAFPIDRQAFLVREVAARLDSLHGDSATSFWRAKATELFDLVVRSGRDRAAASDEVRRFFFAVQQEISAGAATEPMPILSA
ncbi:DUF6074 family protein [Mesorhizobium sp. BR1-1-13]|uniref:DUF6074 family protein n=1 Tax=Mesorhizobium sp. BR1-1-13 TaxID=2876656 RepID=UPI001CD1225D|nr:DUF6074 family protein [Mesorhizobium sp. BR1-1-13]MBZ9941696.1 DUF6074 family protein [Mesorhizobium sp. BR1-1-13]